MEICNSIGAVKYLYKYVFKGSDKIEFSLQNLNNTNNNAPKEDIHKNDEIHKFQEARYVSASESVWRIHNFNTNAQFPHTNRLQIHLENLQSIVFSETAELDTLLDKNIETQLTHYFKLNETDNTVKDLYYYQMPQYFVWNKKKHEWTKRKK